MDQFGMGTKKRSEKSISSGKKSNKSASDTKRKNTMDGKSSILGILPLKIDTTVNEGRLSRVSNVSQFTQ